MDPKEFGCIQELDVRGFYSPSILNLVRHWTDRQTDGQTQNGHQYIMHPTLMGRGVTTMNMNPNLLNPILPAVP